VARPFERVAVGRVVRVVNAFGAELPKLREKHAWQDAAMAAQRDAVVRGDDGVKRCGWGASTPEYTAYHDREWGRPVTDDVRLYEKLCLEGFQSGLSWLTILRKRDGFRTAFRGFEPQRVARFGARDIERLMNDAGIVRNRAKIEATIANARGALAVQDAVGSLAALVWSFEPPARARRAPRTFGDLPPSTPESTALSKALRKYGFAFVGPTTCYAAMQSLGLVNDHFVGCVARGTCEQERRTLTRPAAAPPTKGPRARGR
jgi:DNA-3-methyladenine glycosylase I